MNKCPKTMTGKHYFCYQPWGGDYRKPLLVCIYCDIIDDRTKTNPKKRGLK